MVLRGTSYCAKTAPIINISVSFDEAFYLKCFFYFHYLICSWIQPSVCAFSAKFVCVCISSLRIRYCLVSCLNSWRSWVWDWCFPCFGFLERKRKCQGCLSGTGHSRYSCTSVGWLTRLFFFFFFKVRAGSPPTGQSLRDTPDIFALLHFESLVKIKQETEVELGMLTQNQVVDFLIFLFVLHQQWTCAFHCPKKSLNIPLLHVLVIILAVFFLLQSSIRRW